VLNSSFARPRVGDLSAYGLCCRDVGACVHVGGLGSTAFVPQGTAVEIPQPCKKCVLAQLLLIRDVLQQSSTFDSVITLFNYLGASIIGFFYSITSLSRICMFLDTVCLF
jgi:hypothetical protein